MDTNIIIADLYSRSGASFRIIDAALREELEYAISPFITLENIGKIEDKVKDGLLDLPDHIARRGFDSIRRSNPPVSVSQDIVSCCQQNHTGVQKLLSTRLSRPSPFAASCRNDLGNRLMGYTPGKKNQLVSDRNIGAINIMILPYKLSIINLICREQAANFIENIPFP